jgi:hypothetical protein
MVKDMGDIRFLIEILKSGQILELHDKQWHAECLYLLAMVDYLSRLNDIPLSNEFSELRRTQLIEPIYPSGIILLCIAEGNDDYKKKSWDEAIPEFRHFNIIESDIRNVN